MVSLSIYIFIGTFLYIISINNIVTLFLNYSPKIKTSKEFDSKFIYSPTQGTIQNITYNTDNEVTIRVFLGPLDNHTQYYPVEGKVVYQKHKKGEFYPAFMFKKSKYNESFITVTEFKVNEYDLPKDILDQRKTKIVINQIAGILARRIRTENKVNKNVKFSEKIGKILLGSAVDITLDSRIYKPVVNIGEKVFPLETLLFSLK